MDELLVAIKARAYKNLRPGFSINNQAAVEQFDKECGGIRRALEEGILPRFVNEEPMEEPKEKELAVLRISSMPAPAHEFQLGVLTETVEIHKVNEEEGDGRHEIIIEGVRIVGAFNWLHNQGYTEQVDVIDRVHYIF
eukprot:scaffold69631_cov23-Cyclotella_meneghiniana.AAC.2